LFRRSGGRRPELLERGPALPREYEIHRVLDCRTATRASAASARPAGRPVARPRPPTRNAAPTSAAERERPSDVRHVPSRTRSPRPAGTLRLRARRAICRGCCGSGEFVLCTRSLQPVRLQVCPLLRGGSPAPMRP
jgi:hypothetical protein